jgi:hypothetical protein
MNSAEDLHKGGVSPFGHPRINDRSHLPAAFRSVPRPSSPLGAKASTERPSFTHLSPPPARRTNTQRAKAPSHQARMSNRTADTEYAFLSKTQHHQHQRQPKSQRASAAQGLLNTPFHLHLSKNTRNHPSQDRRSRPGSLFPEDDAAPAGAGITRSTARPQPNTRSGWLGDGRIRTDGPLLAKQALSH